MIKFAVQISIPGYLDAEDELSNLLQGEGEEQELMDTIESEVRGWVATWIPRVLPCEVRVRVEQK